jgi:HK97 gp10 family phage protein
MIKIRGVASTIAAVKGKVAAEVEKQKLRITEELVKELKSNTPVDTGYARDSWAIKEGDIVNTADYIAQLNRGSSKQAPAHFIESTVLSNRKVTANGIIVNEE